MKSVVRRRKELKELIRLKNEEPEKLTHRDENRLKHLIKRRQRGEL